jgi:hypothetical protein
MWQAYKRRTQNLVIDEMMCLVAGISNRQTNRGGKVFFSEFKLDH